MIVACLKETHKHENRVAVVPAAIKEYNKSGLKLIIESDAGKASYFYDNLYIDSGAEISSDRNALIKKADVLIKVNPPTIEEAKLLKDQSIFISLFQTTKEKELVNIFLEKRITAFSMHLIPRTTLAQKMDALSSQANIAGYMSVLIGSASLPVYMPLLMTAAGTIPPAKVLVLGAGVAGLQAIATAKRLGAHVEAFDVRPDVKEQVESLGAKFIEVDHEQNEGVGQGGYAKETSEDYKQKQQILIKEKISKSNLVITTALIPGRPAPILIPKDMVEAMKPGSIIMDLAAENGGNCELTEKDKIVKYNGIIINGSSNLPSKMPLHASQLYSKNLSSFLIYLTNNGQINLNFEDEIISGSMFTHNGEITHQSTLEYYNNNK